MTSSRELTSRLMLLPMLLAAAWMLTACAVSAPSSSVGINLPALPAPKVSCVPTTLPAKALSKAEVEKLWARDRATLVKCGYTIGSLITFYQDLSRRLRAAGNR